MAKIPLSLKKLLAPILYRHYPIGLSPARLRLYLNWVYETADLPGSVLEIGCNTCGTSAFAKRMLRDIGKDKPYYCIDTFSGFVKEQFTEDVALGNREARRAAFSSNDISLARKVLSLHNAEDVSLIQGDIVSFSADKLPDPISVCLIDVDLYRPVLVALEKVYPLLVDSGAIIIDDCPENIDWQARKAYAEFVEKHNLPFRVEHGMGIIVKEAT